MDPIQPARRPDSASDPATNVNSIGTRPDTAPTDQTEPGTATAWNMGANPEPAPEPAAPRPLSPEYAAASQPDEFGDVPSQQDHMVVGGSGDSSSYNVVPPQQDTPPPARPKSRKKWWLAGGVAGLVILLAGGWAFGFYLPNRPENVWKTGLDRTGEALDKVVSDATDSKKLAALKTASLSGDISIKSAEFNGSGTYNVKSDDVTSDSGVTIKLKPEGDREYSLSAKAITKLAPNKMYPDIYFQIAGIKDLGLDAFMPGISDYDGKWIYASSDFIQKYSDEAGLATKKDDKITTDDAAEVTRNVTKTVRDYFLTSDPSKAVLENKQFVGKEKVDDLNTYHYKVGINEKNAKAFCAALWNGVATTNVYKKLVDEKDRTSQKDSLIKDCQEDDPSSKNEQFDMWIDGHYKLIHKIRVNDETVKGAYMDFGQTYKGDDTLNLFATYHNPEDKYDLKWDHTTNTSTNESSGTISMIGYDASDKYSIESDYRVKMDKAALDVAAPKDVTPIENLLKKLGIPTEPEKVLPEKTESI